MIYTEQLQKLNNIYTSSQKAENDEFFNHLLKELRQLSNAWHDLQKNNEISLLVKSN